MTYLLLSGVFITIAAAVAGWAVVRQRRSAEAAPFTWRSAVIAAIILLLLTAVFDNIMIATGLFTYAEGPISGVRIGLAPIEDFSYPIAAVLLLPAVWILLGGAQEGRSP